MRLLPSIHIPQSFQRMASVFKSILARKRIQMDDCDPPIPSWEKTAAITKEKGADEKGCIHLVYSVVGGRVHVVIAVSVDWAALCALPVISI